MSLNDGFAHIGKLNEKIDNTISPTDKEIDYNIQKVIIETATNVVWIKGHLKDNEKEIKNLNGRIRAVENQQGIINGKFSVLFIGVSGLISGLAYLFMRIAGK